jgi:hypothetical protein
MQGKEAEKTHFCRFQDKQNYFFKVTNRQQELLVKQSKKLEKATKTRSDNYFSFCFDAKAYTKGKNNKKLCHFSLHEHSKPDIADLVSLQN